MPVMVIEYVPGVVLVVVPTDNVEEPEPDIEGGLKVGVMVELVGDMLADRTIVPEKLFKAEVVTVKFPGAPCVTAAELGEADIVKSGVADPPHESNLNEAIWVFQLNVPFAAKYSFVYQNVQSSLGSIRMAL